MAFTLKIFCDGGSRGNPGPAAGGTVIYAPAVKKRFFCGKYLGVQTNNFAEYSAVKLAFDMVKNNFQQIDQIDFYLDSQLVVSQLNGEFRIKNENIKPLYHDIKLLEHLSPQINYHHIPREQNREAEALVNKTLDLERDFLYSEELEA
jgi:ribonuclease HI